ncbi:alpha/beta hydrolase [Pseudomonas citronellolis]|uniref:alpha/beta hydrolase n=1 Tax=Pseudomonas citronellolis TaxID=53408 RepID=UPI00078CA0AE|nr:dienelactone hydrolase family protein [Pseudomonas citronellolis]AMO76102.1 putative hydrolase [Pseudomonas citronellolis]
MSDNIHLHLPTYASGPAPEAVGRAVILIHGRTQSPADMFAVAKRIDLPEAPYIAVEAAGNSWYPDKFMAPLANNQPHLDFALQRLEWLVVELEGLGVPRSRIVLVGFSQGACLACEYLYRYPQRWGGLIAFTGGLIGPEGLAWESHPKLDSTPILLTNGDNDPWVPLARTQETLATFQAMGAKAELHVYPGREHQVSDAEVDLGRALLQRIFTN